MSTTTINFGLIKPELTDAADITATNQNWDTLDRVIKENKDEAKNYTDEKFGNIPAPDVSGQINAHNTSDEAHSDIRTAVNEAKQSASKALTDAKSYTDTKIAAIPTPDVSVQIGAHNTNTSAHADIRTAAANALSVANSKANASHTHTASEVGALPIEGGTLTGTELGIGNNKGKMVANGNMFRVFATNEPSDTNNQRYLNFYSQYFKGDVSESLKLTERINGVDTSYKIYGEHNITSGTTDLTAGTSELPSGHIYFVYE